MDAPDRDDEWTRERVCERCGRPYKMADQDESYLPPPYDYQSCWKTTCLSCWLGVGPKDFPASHGEGFPATEAPSP